MVKKVDVIDVYPDTEDPDYKITYDFELDGFDSDEMKGEKTCSNDKELLERKGRESGPIEHKESKVWKAIAKVADTIARLLDRMQGGKW